MGEEWSEVNTVCRRELGTNGRSSPVLESHTTVDEDPEAGIAMTGVSWREVEGLEAQGPLLEPLLRR